MGFWIFGKKEEAKKIDRLHNHVSESFSRVKDDINKIGVWIRHLDEHKNKHYNRLEEFEKRLLILEDIIHFREKKEPGIERSSVQAFNRIQSRSVQSFMNVQSLETLSEIITPKEKKVIMCLLEAEMPLEYVDIAKKLGISIITTRRHINDIKKSGFKIEEKMNVDTKRKIFFIKNEVKNAILGKNGMSKTVKIIGKSVKKGKK